ncbi:hypothetical protein RA985_20100, partial [Mycobacteroides abscessus subsp. abscessus]
LKPFGLWFTPGPASGVADKDLAAFRKAEKREWIEGIVRGEAGTDRSAAESDGRSGCLQSRAGME